MAANSGVNTVHATLGAGVADTFTLTGKVDEVLITHCGPAAVTAPIYVRSDGTTAVAAATGTIAILPNQSRRFRAGAGAANPVYSIICAGAALVAFESA